MTSYFDEHDCDPLPDTETSNRPVDFLEFARFLILTGNWQNNEFASMFADRPPPPTSRSFIESLERERVDASSKLLGSECPICLKKYELEDQFIQLKCGHCFHDSCLLPWLEKTCSCPMCRASLPSSDPDWEELQRQKKREKEREVDLEALHNSMFG